MDRRGFLKRMGVGALSISSLVESLACAGGRARHPNVLFIVIDDLNDWVGVLGGHPQVRTPHIDRFASSGVLFSNAHCDVPECLASRIAVLTGLRPASSGIYGGGRSVDLRNVLPDVQTLPQAFMRSGYWVAGSGKIFHRPDPDSWNEYFPSKLEAIPSEPRSRAPAEEPLLPGSGYARVLGPWRSAVEGSGTELSDSQVVAWVSQQLAERRKSPFFLGCGLSRPHLPWHVPQSYYAMYPEAEVLLPPIKADDLADVSPRRRAFHRVWDDLVARGNERKVIQGYLASISFADAMVGQLLTSLDESEHRDDTIVVLWSDNGVHMGEKSHIFKSRLWEESTRVPLILRAPGVSVPGGICERSVNLVDLYPTLAELCHLKVSGPLDGESLVGLLRDPKAPWRIPALSANGPGDYAVRSERWRYIRYRDGFEELYDHDVDPNEWTNLAADPGYRAIMNELATWIPEPRNSAR